MSDNLFIQTSDARSKFVMSWYIALTLPDNIRPSVFRISSLFMCLQVTKESFTCHQLWISISTARRSTDISMVSSAPALATVQHFVILVRSCESLLLNLAYSWNDKGSRQKENTLTSIYVSLSESNNLWQSIYHANNPKTFSPLTSRVINSESFAEPLW